jgi:hypothetical protein
MNLILDTYAELKIVNQKTSKLQTMSESAVEYKFQRPSVQNLHGQAAESITKALNALKDFVPADK